MQDQDLQELVTDLHRRHPGFRRATVERLAVRVAEQYRTAPVQAFVPVLVRREVDQQLRYAESIAVPDEPAPRRDSLLNA